jgi:NAD+ synthase
MKTKSFDAFKESSTTMNSLLIMSAQINPSRGVGDLAGNAIAHADIWKQADAQGVDLIVMPEQSITGYPLEDLAAQPDILAGSQIVLEHLVEMSKSMKAAMLVGAPEYDDGKVYNTMYLIEHGTIIGKVRKHDLPNDDVFDEKRIYTSNKDISPIEFRGHKLGIMICEDLWHKEVAASLAKQGAQALIVPNASPWYVGKEKFRITDVLTPRVQETGLPILYVNQVGGMDELIFDGHSLAMNADQQVTYTAKGFEQSLDVVELKFDGKEASFKPTTIEPFYEETQSIWQALVLGTRDYVKKNGFKKVHLGKSGGIDSAVVAAIAVDALGPENVNLYKLPSKYTQADSNDDANVTAQFLGAKIEEINIWPTYEVATNELKDHFTSNRDDTTFANLQARIRGLFLMALSNRNDSLLLSTGNKSEMSVGWATLYGDMNGAFNPIKGVDKLLVYRLAEWRNNNVPNNVLGPKGPAIAQNTIDKRAKAELGPGNNFDEDVLAPYPVLVDVSRRYVEKNQSVEQIKQETGYEDPHIEDTIRRTDQAEFKRRQSCPGLKINRRDFGKGYRMPITRPDTISMLRDLNLLKPV